MTEKELQTILFGTANYLKSAGLDKEYEIKLSLDKETLQNIENNHYLTIAVTAVEFINNKYCGLNFDIEDKTSVKIVKKEEPKLKDVERPFEDCQELIRTYCERLKKIDGFDVVDTVLQLPTIWVRLNVDGRKRMIVGYGDGFVEVGVKAKPVTLEHLYKSYTFLDGSICGVKEVSYE